MTESDTVLKSAEDLVDERRTNETADVRARLRQEKEAAVKAENYLKQAEEIRNSGDDDVDEQIQALNEEIAQDEAVADLVEKMGHDPAEYGFDDDDEDIEVIEQSVTKDAGIDKSKTDAGDSPDTESDDSEFQDSEPIGLAELRKALSILDSFQEVFSFLQSHLQDQQPIDLVDIKIWKYLRKEYPSLAADLKEWGFDTNPELDSKNHSVSRQYSKLATEAKKIRLQKPEGALTAADFSDVLPDMPAVVREKIMPLLDESLTALRDDRLEKRLPTFFDYTTGQIRRALRNSIQPNLSYIATTASGSRTVSIANFEVNLSDTRIDEHAQSEVWLTRSEINQQAEKARQILEAARQAATMLTTPEELEALDDEILATYDSRFAHVEQLATTLSVDDEETQKAIIRHLTTKLKKEYDRRQTVQKEAAAERKAQLDFFDWEIGVYLQSDEMRRPLHDQPGYIALDMNLPAKEIDVETDIFKRDKILFEEGTGVHDLCGGNWSNLNDLLNGFMEQRILHHAEVTRKVDWARGKIIAQDLHDYLKGINAGYADETAPENATDSFIQGQQRGQQLRSSSQQ